MVLAVKCKKTAEDENIFVGGSDENDSESDLLAREKRGGLEQRGQRRSDLGRENVCKEQSSRMKSQLIKKDSAANRQSVRPIKRKDKCFLSQR